MPSHKMRLRRMLHLRGAENLSGPPKTFFLDGDTKKRATKGRCQAKRVWGHAPPENFAEFDLISEAFRAFKISQF